jgi:hypothetical protein
MHQHPNVRISSSVSVRTFPSSEAAVVRHVPVLHVQRVPVYDELEHVAAARRKPGIVRIVQTSAA